VARELLVERLQRELLALRLGQARLELDQLGAGVALPILRLARHAARLPRVGLDVAQPARQLLLGGVDALASAAERRMAQRSSQVVRRRGREFSGACPCGWLLSCVSSWLLSMAREAKYATSASAVSSSPGPATTSSGMPTSRARSATRAWLTKSGLAASRGTPSSVMRLSRLAVDDTVSASTSPRSHAAMSGAMSACGNIRR